MSFFQLSDAVTARRWFIGKSGLMLSGAAVALLAGKDEMIATLNSHDKHMRRQLNQSHAIITKQTDDIVKQSDNVTKIASQMLHTMEAIGTAGKTFILPASSQDPNHDSGPRLFDGSK